ncbi:MAG: phosphodiesterase [Solirubrobacteraceae bacterium]
MPTPFLLLQLSDTHIGADWGEGDPVSDLEAAIASVRRLPDPPDAVLVSGDVANGGEDGQYARAYELLDRLPGPVYVMAGNHDDREQLRRHFSLPGSGGEPIQYAVDLDAARLVVVDTTRPGADDGELDEERLAWLQDALSEAPDRLTVLALHHPPLITGIEPWDATALSADHRRALLDVLDRHPQVKLLVAGHVHRMIVTRFGGRPLITVPSTHLQAKLQFGPSQLELTAEPPAYVLHSVVDGEVVSHLQPVALG